MTLTTYSKAMKPLKKASSCALLLSITLVGSVVGWNQGSLSLSQPAEAQTACDTTIRSVSFSGRTSGSMTGKPNVNTNMRSNTTTSASILATIPPNTALTLTGWAYGQGITDIWTGKVDYRWFRVNYGGRTGWVASGVIYGNPPSSPLAPSCPTSATSTNFTMSEYYSRLYGHTIGASSRGYISSHNGIDSTDTLTPHNVLAIVGGKVVGVKKDGAVLQSVSASSNSGWHPTLKRWVRASDYSNHVLIYNADLNRYFLYLHLSRVDVNNGAIVNPRQMIGIEGSTGWSTGRHTHVGVRNASSVYENPLATLGKARSSGILNKNYR